MEESNQHMFNRTYIYTRFEENKAVWTNLSPRCGCTESPWWGRRPCSSSLCRPRTECRSSCRCRRGTHPAARRTTPVCRTLTLPCDTVYPLVAAEGRYQRFDYVDFSPSTAQKKLRSDKMTNKCSSYDKCYT